MPHNGRCRSPTNSDAIVNMIRPAPGLKNPTIILVVRKTQKFGENALKKPVMIITATEGKSTFKRPNLK